MKTSPNVVIKLPLAIALCCMTSHSVAGDVLLPAMVELPGGSFIQGSAPEEPGHRPNEAPAHKVQVARFYLSQHEVTVGQFRQFVEASGYTTDAERQLPVGEQLAAGCWSHQRRDEASPAWVAEHSWRDPGFPQSDEHPAVCISWNDAVAYAQWLSERTGDAYRLPTESEFEYAQRAASQSEPDCANTNLADERLRTVFKTWRGTTLSCDDGYAFSAPVGTYPKSDRGVFDLAGNASEWTADCWQADYLGAPVDGSARQAQADHECEARVLRGGDFMGQPEQLRPAHRTSIPPAFRTYHAGFRVARDR